MSGEKGIPKKIMETKKQTEELKTQIQNLIDEGKNLVCPSQSKSNLLLINEVKDEPLKSPNKVQILKSYENKHSKQKSDPNIPKKTENVESPKKPRTYDVKEARKYIKKQKEKRLEQSKIKNEAKINAEMQKKKLQELHKKSLLLLAQNVRAKRSKSTDKSTYVRPHETNLTNNIQKSKSMDKINSTHPVKHKNPNLLYPPSPESTNKLYSNAKGTSEKNHPEKIVILARNFTRGGEMNKKHSATITFREKLDGKLDKTTNEAFPTDIIINKQESNDEGRTTKTNDGRKIRSFEHLTARKLFSTENAEHDNQILQSVKTNGDFVKNILEYKSPQSYLSNITIRSPNDVIIEKGTQMCASNLTPTEDKSESNIKKPDDILKYSKEIQTEIIQKDCPKWLEEQPPQAYPFNFINTMTKKLQVANNTKLKTDIGIQNSLTTPIPIEKTEMLLLKNNQNDSKKGLKSFISHTCLNLDPAGIEHLELIPKKTYDLQKYPIQITETESESDTSKNIPEISSESGTSLKKNKESVKKASTFNRNLAISTDKIDNMKLVPHTVCTTGSDSQIHSDSKLNKNNSSSKKYGSKLTVDNNYASDFDTDIEGEASLNRSRRSIISFNKSGYDKVKISSPEPLSEVSSARSQTSRNKNVSSINTEMLMSSNASKSSNNKIIENGDGEHGMEFQKSKSFTSISKDSSLETVDVKKPQSEYIETKNDKIDSTIREHQIITSSKNSAAGTETRLSGSISTNLSRSEVSIKNINTQRGSSNLSEEEKSNILLPLSEPKASLSRDSERIKSQSKDKSSEMVRNFSVRSSKVSTKADAKDSNQIHLKFEAEIHLLNDFNESLRRFSALEQALETLKTKNTITSKNLQNSDAGTCSKTKISENLVRSKETRSQTSQINFSRGSFINNSSTCEDLNILTDSAIDKDETSILSTGLEVSNLNLIDQSMSVHSEDYLSNFENIQSVNFAGLSLNMFEQMIKDEDARLENLKTILKIREQALLDRTKGELAWLEIQRKHFKETGKFHEASVIKKKQRAILVNHQKEKHEMQRLKQMQKAASIERKIVLKGQRNIIRQQLSTDNMLTKMKVKVPKERRLSGPLKVLQSHTESIRSETSITKRSSSDREKDVFSITSHHSTTHHSLVSEMSEIDVPCKEVTSLERQNCIKRTLLMREEALKKRRKAAEELLQWHTKLLEEEKRINVLESAASAIISQKPSTTTATKPQEKFNFKGKQLNQLWLNLTGSEGKKFVNDKIYPMSQLALERFCKSAREYSLQTRTLLKKSGENDDISIDENVPTQKSSSDKDYISDFENESSPNVDQSIDILINNFNQIQDDISTLNITQSKKSEESRTDEIISEHLSVIETNKISEEVFVGESTSDKENSLKIAPDLEPESVVAENSAVPSEASESSSSSNIKLIIKDAPAINDEIEETSSHNDSIENNSVIQKEDIEDRTEPEETILPVEETILPVEETILPVEETILPVSTETKESLNESQEILSILGESEVKTSSDEEIVEVQLKDSLTESEEILSKLNQIVTVETTGSVIESEETDQDMLSDSLLRLYAINGSVKDNEVDILQDFSALERKQEEITEKTVNPIEEINDIHEESDESKLTGSDKSNESFIINEENEESIQKQEEKSEKLSKDSEVNEKSEEEIKTEESVSEGPISNLSYGIIEKSRSEKDTETPTGKEEVCYEEKEHDSLSSITGGSSSDLSEQVSVSQSDVIKNKAEVDEIVASKSSSDVTADLKKRVYEILADTNVSRGDKSPRLQDLYVTTYDLISPSDSPEKAPSSPVEEHKLVSSIFNSEAEELLRKQLAVEKEIKAITDQQKEQLPLMYVREIPNKPPPPYTPPSPLSLISPPTIIPTAEEIEEITMYSAKILHKAYLSNNLTNVNISNNTLSLISKNISKDCYKFVFNLCKEIARDHYKQFEEDDSFPWLRIPKKIESSLIKPLGTEGLKVHLIKSLKELLGYQKPPKKENANIKWIRKKRDHVDEILVMECQQEEAQWTNYQKDELLVKDEITNDIFDSLLVDTVDVFKKLFLKRNS